MPAWISRAATVAQAAVLGLCLLLPAGRALAGPFALGATQSVTHESNVLRAEEGQAIPGTLSRADTVWTSTLQGGIVQPLGRQRLFGNILLRHAHFERNTVYDNSGYKLDAGAEWATVNQLSGSFGLTAQRNLAQFSNDEAGFLTRSNIEQTKLAESALRWGVSARLAAEASLSWRSVSFSAPEFASREFRQGIGYVGLRHELSGALWWSLGLRQSRGNYPKFRRITDGYEADRFERQELTLRSSFRPGGSSDIDARLALGRTRYDNAVNRNLSGLSGAIDWNWRPTGRLRLQTHWSRDPSQDSYFLNTLFGRGTLSYDRVATTVQLKADLSLSPKTGVYAAWGWTDRSFLRSIAIGGGSQSDVRSDDRTQQYALGVRWQPTRSLQFGLDVTGEDRRQTTALSRPYRSTSVTTFGQFNID